MLEFIWINLQLICLCIFPPLALLCLWVQLFELRRFGCRSFWLRLVFMVFLSVVCVVAYTEILDLARALLIIGEF